MLPGQSFVRSWQPLVFSPRDTAVEARGAQWVQVLARLKGPLSPQKQAAVRALRAVTGQDFGDRAADWRAGLAVALMGR